MSDELMTPATEIEIGEVINTLRPCPSLALAVRRLAFERDQLRAALARHADDGKMIRVDPDVIRCLLKFGGPQSQDIGPRTMWAAAVNNARDVLARHGISMDA